MEEISIWDSQGVQLLDLVQWDKNIIVKIKESKINAAYDVHFSSGEDEESYVVKSAYSNGVLSVKIPNILLTKPYPIYGYIYSRKPNGESRTLYNFVVFVKARPSYM